MSANQNTSLKPLTAKDAAWMEDIHAQSFEAMQRWRKEEFIGLMLQPLNKSFAIMVNGEPAGFIMARNVAGEGEILTLAIHPRHRRNGYATQLVNAFIAAETEHDLKSLFLEVMVTNKAAVELYTALGFAIISSRPGYYQMPAGHAEKSIDGLVMKKILPTSQHVHKSP